MEFLLDLPIIKGHILSVIIFLPLLAVAALLFVRNDRAARLITLIAMIADFILTIPLLLRFDKGTAAMQFVERGEWIPSFNIEYYLGVDGISVLFIFLTGLIGWICVLASWTSVEKRVREFMITLLVIQAAMMGVFASLDFFLFYIFWEAMLIPMYLIIGVWGGPRRVYAAIKFFLYTLAGSILMLVGIIALYFAGGSTFDIPLLMTKEYAFGFQAFVFVLFFIAFAIKVPMFPFHTWLPDAHVEAPTAGSIILAAVLLKMGTYGFLRFSFPMFPDASLYFATPIIILSIIAIIYGAFLALSQDDMKKLIAYSSVSHMGFVTFGLFLFNKNGIEGAVLQMFNHGITTGALFLCVGLIYERTHTRNLKDYGWAARLVPVYAVFLFIFSIASLGFPGTNGFIGEFLILAGAYASHKFYLFFLLIGIALGAAYMLSMYQRVSFGAVRGTQAELGSGHGNEAGHGCVCDVNLREAVALAAFLTFVFWVGFQPMDFLDVMHVSVANLIAQVTGAPAASF
ncbi:MAG: NADH-quinone oxidoreductase subunit M [Thermodesulfobacteriota bacterium]